MTVVGSSLEKLGSKSNSKDMRPGRKWWTGAIAGSAEANGTETKVEELAASATAEYNASGVANDDVTTA